MAARETRQQIISAADRLFYEQGFEATSFADIAAAVGLSRGNFYYHFRAKDALLEAVIAFRVEKTRALLKQWEEASDSPTECIVSFVRLLIENRTKIMAHGCPVGSLCEELAKMEHQAKRDAAQLFALFRDWLSMQFKRAGRGRDSDVLAMHVLMRSQGIATLAMALEEDVFVDREVSELIAWVQTQTGAATTAYRPS